MNRYGWHSLNRYNWHGFDRYEWHGFTDISISQGEFCGVLSDTYEQKAEQKIFYSKVVADKSDLTRHPIPVLNNIDADKFNEVLETNLAKIDKEVRYLVNVFLPESTEV